MSSSSRIIGFDLIKSVSIFFVVFYHVGGFNYGQIIEGEYYLPNFAKFCSAFCSAGVPLFFMVNGALILPRQLSFTQYALKSAKLIVLYFSSIFILQYLLCRCLFGIQEQMVHFWFIRTLAIVYPICWFLERVPLFRKLVLIFLAIIPFCSNFVIDLLLCAFPDMEILSPSYHIGLFTQYSILYLYLGFFLYRQNIDIFFSALLIICGVLLINFEVIVMSNYTHQIYDSVNAAFPTVGALLLSVGIFSLFQNIEIHILPIRNLITIVGSNTLSIYLLHVLFLFWFRHFFPGWIESMNNIVILIFVLLIMVVSFVCGIIAKKGVSQVIIWYGRKD